MSILDHGSGLRLYWYNGHGVARTHGAQQILSLAPDLGFAFVEIDYAPGVVSQIRRRPCDALGELDETERRACRLFLAGLRRHDKPA